MSEEDERAIARRTVVAALGTGVVVLGAAAAAREASAAETVWQPTLEKHDDWMELPGRHRMVFDATTAEGAGHALFFVRNYIGVNGKEYGVAPTDLATIIILRHTATVFAYRDAIWAKYGKVLSNLSGFTDPKTKDAPERNLYDAKGYGHGLINSDATLSDMAAQGVHFAVCGAATQRIAASAAESIDGDAAAVHRELLAHLIPNGRIVPAGIVAVNRAQERGYALTFAG